MQTLSSSNGVSAISGGLSHADLRSDIVGIDTIVPLLNGTETRYVFLDNAASTPTFRRVLNAIDEFMPWYSGVHRGMGLKSLVATEAWDEAHDIIGKFVGADLRTNAVVLVKNSTEAINKLANRCCLTGNDVVITTQMEHHSDDLPWRKYCTVIHVGVHDDGHLDLEEFQKTLKANKGKIKLVAVSGASNITGICNPIHTIARWVHEAGSKLFVDAAQLAPHRPIDMLPDGHPEHIDFLAFSAHKMYAPFGTGVLIGPRTFFDNGEPDMVGGGVVDTVTLNGVRWNSPPDKDEAGSPNVVGAIALAKTILVLQEAGMENIARHEQELLEYAYDKLKKIPNIELYGPLNDMSDKVGVITFNVRDMNHAHAASIFAREAGIGLRNGCFCAQPYMRRLMLINPDCDFSLEEDPATRDRANMNGMVRASLGCYSNEEDIDRFVDALNMIARKQFSGTYVGDSVTGEYVPQGVPEIDPHRFYSLYEAGTPVSDRPRNENRPCT